MPDRVEGARKIHGGQHGSRARLRAVKAIGDRLSKKNYLVSGGAAWAKTGLKRGQKVPRLEKERETGKHETFEKFGNARCKTDRTKRRGSVCGFARFVHRVDSGRFPSGGKRLGGPREIEDEQKERHGRRRKVSK